MTIKLDFKAQTFMIDGNSTKLDNGRYIKTESSLGKRLQFLYPHICVDLDDKIRNEEATGVVQEVESELLLEEPIQAAEVVSDEPETEVDVTTEVEPEETPTEVVQEFEVVQIPSLAPLSTFKDKDELEDTGKTYGIDLKKNKSLKNMYNDLEAHIKTL